MGIPIPIPIPIPKGVVMDSWHLRPPPPPCPFFVDPSVTANIFGYTKELVDIEDEILVLRNRIRDFADRHKFVTALLKELKPVQHFPQDHFPPGIIMGTSASFGPRGRFTRPREHPYPETPIVTRQLSPQLGRQSGRRGLGPGPQKRAHTAPKLRSKVVFPVDACPAHDDCW